MISYVAKDLATGVRLAGHADVQLPALSTIKVLVAAAFWRAVAAGELSETRPFAFQPWASVRGGGVLGGFRHAAKFGFGDLAHLMLAVGDDDATNIIASFVKLERVDALAAELGLTSTRMRRAIVGGAATEKRDNLTAAADLAALLEELASGDRLSPAVSGPVWTSLERQQHRDGIARYLPQSATYAGMYDDDGPEGGHAHDCCLGREGRRRAVIVVMTEDAGGRETVSRLGAALYDTLSRTPAHPD